MCLALNFKGRYGHFFKKELIDNIINDELTIYQDEKLNALSNSLLVELQQLTRQISLNDIGSDKNPAQLEVIQQQFKKLSNNNLKLNLRSNELISSYAQQMKSSADNAQSTLLNSLISIPITIIIAGVFALLIIRPLRKLSQQIYELEQGHFDKKISFNGSQEIKEIADALELMRARLHAMELQKSSFIRHISHELKTPLAAIREGTELLYDNSVGELNDDQQEITNILKESVFRLQNLIEDLLDFNIVLDSTSLLNNQNIDLSQLINTNIAQRKLGIQSKNLSVITHLQPLLLQTNTKQLSVILDNILSNAIKYSIEGGEISITTSILKDQLIIKIIDQGPGIEPQAMSKVFDAFYQGNAPIDSHIKGSGLGLTIVKELLMRLNGEIQLISNSQPNQGLEITLFFPYHQIR